MVYISVVMTAAKRQLSRGAVVTGRVSSGLTGRRRSLHTRTRCTNGSITLSILAQQPPIKQIFPNLDYAFSLRTVSTDSDRTFCVNWFLFYFGPQEGCEVLRSVCLYVGLSVSVRLSARISQQELSSCSDGRSFGHNRHGPKNGGCCAAFRGGTGSPSNTMWPGPTHTPVPSGILIHPAVWPQRHRP